MNEEVSMVVHGLALALALYMIMKWRSGVLDGRILNDRSERRQQKVEELIRENGDLKEKNRDMIAVLQVTKRDVSFMKDRLMALNDPYAITPSEREASMALKAREAKHAEEMRAQRSAAIRSVASTHKPVSRPATKKPYSSHSDDDMPVGSFFGAYDGGGGGSDGGSCDSGGSSDGGGGSCGGGD